MKSEESSPGKSFSRYLNRQGISDCSVKIRMIDQAVCFGIAVDTHGETYAFGVELSTSGIDRDDEEDEIGNSQKRLKALGVKNIFKAHQFTQVFLPFKVKQVS
jgi:hypothetical protein